MVSGHIFGCHCLEGADAVNIKSSTSNCSSFMAQGDLTTELSSSSIARAKIKKLLYALGEYWSLSK